MAWSSKQPGNDSFEAVAKQYLKHQRVRVSNDSYLREKVSLERHLIPFFAGRIAAIRRADVQRYVTKRSGDVAPGTVRKELNTLTHLLSLSVEWEIIPFNPAQRIKSPRLPAGRVRYLQPGELRALIEASLDWLKPIVDTRGQHRNEEIGNSGFTLARRRHPARPHFAPTEQERRGQHHLPQQVCSISYRVAAIL